MPKRINTSFDDPEELKKEKNFYKVASGTNEYFKLLVKYKKTNGISQVNEATTGVGLSSSVVNVTKKNHYKTIFNSIMFNHRERLLEHIGTENHIIGSLYEYLACQYYNHPKSNEIGTYVWDKLIDIDTILNETSGDVPIFINQLRKKIEKDNAVKNDDLKKYEECYKTALQDITETIINKLSIQNRSMVIPDGVPNFNDIIVRELAATLKLIINKNKETGPIIEYPTYYEIITEMANDTKRYRTIKKQKGDAGDIFQFDGLITKEQDFSPEGIRKEIFKNAVLKKFKYLTEAERYQEKITKLEEAYKNDKSQTEETKILNALKTNLNPPNSSFRKTSAIRRRSKKSGDRSADGQGTRRGGQKKTQKGKRTYTVGGRGMTRNEVLTKYFDDKIFKTDSEIKKYITGNIKKSNINTIKILMCPEVAEDGSYFSKKRLKTGYLQQFVLANYKKVNSLSFFIESIYHFKAGLALKDSAKKRKLDAKLILNRNLLIKQIETLIEECDKASEGEKIEGKDIEKQLKKEEKMALDNGLPFNPSKRRKAIAKEMQTDAQTKQKELKKKT